LDGTGENGHPDSIRGRYASADGAESCSGGFKLEVGAGRPFGEEELAKALILTLTLTLTLALNLIPDPRPYWLRSRSQLN